MFGDSMAGDCLASRDAGAVPLLDGQEASLGFVVFLVESAAELL